jgi:anti-anti-sigma regulatory factor
VSVVGELDLTTSPALHERLVEAAGHVMIDCSELAFADSIATAEVVALAQRAASGTPEHPTPILRRHSKPLD